MIQFNFDGSVLLEDDLNPARQQSVAAGWTHDSLRAASLAFFGPDPIPPVPTEVSMMQAQLLMAQTPSASGTAGRTLLDDVEAIIATAPRATQIYWRTSTKLHRDHAVVAQLATQLNLTGAQVDTMFRNAVTLT